MEERMKIRLSLYALFGALLSAQIITEAQTKGCNPEIQSMARSLSQLASQSNCQGDFVIRERRIGDAIFYDVSYVVRGKAIFRQTFKSSIEQYVSLTPIKVSGCSSLFITYQMGADGTYQNSYIIFPSASRFRCLALSEEDYFHVEDIDQDGETEIVVQSVESPTEDFPCSKFAYWGRIFHLDRTSGNLVEMNGSNYPKYYASLLKTLRDGYENIRNDRDVSIRCKQTYLQLIGRAERLAKAVVAQ
jgi:hypothetical protein